MVTFEIREITADYLELVGNFRHGDANEMLDKTLKIIPLGVTPKVTLDLSGVSHCDSGTLGTFVKYHLEMLKTGRTLVLLDPPKRFQEMLAVTKLCTVLNCEYSQQRPK